MVEGSRDDIRVSAQAVRRVVDEKGGSTKSSLSDLLRVFDLKKLTPDASKEIQAALREQDLITTPALNQLTGRLWKTSMVVVERGEAAARGEEDDAVDVSPVGLGLALAGAAAMIVAIFLPFADSEKFVKVAENSLIQQGSGWGFIFFGTAIAAAAYQAFHRNRKTWAVIVLGLMALGLAIYLGTSDEVLTLSSANPPEEIGGEDFGLNEALRELAAPEKANPGIGIYMAGVGGLLAILGGWQIRNSPYASRPKRAQTDGARAQPAAQPTKVCPDCAETVLEAARVCKHCGFRFA